MVVEAGVYKPGMEDGVEIVEELVPIGEGSWH